MTNLAPFIDHTNLNPLATQADIQKLCEEASDYGFASVCVNPVWVPFASGLFAKEYLRRLNMTQQMVPDDVVECIRMGTYLSSELLDSLPDSTLKHTPAVCTVIGFPLGASAHGAKTEEARLAVEQGARELDMVIDLGAAKSGNWNEVEQDIAGVVRTIQKTHYDVLVKVIIETCYLTDNEIIQACLCAKRAGANFVKTSTGFATPGVDEFGQPVPNGATVEHVKLMKHTVGDTMEIKASGGIRNRETAQAMVDAGATRIGTSSGLKIISEC